MPKEEVVSPFDVTKKRRYIQSGELAVSTEGEIIATVLGSCVAVCIFDRRLKIGGMNHFLLPTPTNERTNLPLEVGVTAIPALLSEFKRLGSRPQDLVAKIFGGGQSEVTATCGVGSANINVAKSMLADFGIPVVSSATGEKRGRKVEFDSATGEARVQVLRKGDERVTEDNGRVRVLVVDDSATARKLLRDVISQNPLLEVVGEAENADEAEVIRARTRPQVMTLDLHMPGRDGVAYLKEMMNKNPMPAVIVSDFNLKHTGPVMAALEAGAFDYMKKPNLFELETKGRELHEKLISASRVNIALLCGKPVRKTTRVDEGITRIHDIPKGKVSLIAIGASTGGTEAIRSVLTALPPDMPPIVVVQHMPPVFTASFANRLNELCSVRVKEATQGDVLERGKAYIAPGGFHMKVITSADGKMKIDLNREPEENRFRPSVDYLFRSVAQLPIVSSSVALLLTGMGEDGAKGLAMLREKGAWTVAQGESSCVVFGMPKAAIERGGAKRVLELDEMPGVLRLCA